MLHEASHAGAHGAGEQRVQLHNGRQRQLQTNARALRVWMTGLSPTNATGVHVSALVRGARPPGGPGKKDMKNSC